MRLKLRGDVTTIAGAFRQLPSRQLVVIGKAEAGKTSLAVILVRDLLAHWRADEPVPVMFSLSGWDPTKQHLDTWISERLRDLHPWLADEGRFGRNTVKQLVRDRDRGVLPILDGLDELPKELRHQAIAALNEAIGQERQLVLTCRSTEYQEAIMAAGIPLARAAVVEIEAVSAAQASLYLPLGQYDGTRRWAPVVAHLKAHPDGGLAEALSTPLMVYLARTAYAKDDPLALTKLGDRSAVERHLLKSYVPAIYRPRLPADDDGAAPLYQCTPEQAGKWLGNLARHMQRQVPQELAWWKLPAAGPRALSTLTMGLLGTLAGALWLHFPIGWGAGLIVGLLVAAAVGQVMNSPTSNAGLAQGLAGGLLGGIAGALLSHAVVGGPLHLDEAGRAVFGGVGTGVAVAIMRSFRAGLLGGFAGGVAGWPIEFLAGTHPPAVAIYLANGLSLGVAAGLAAGVASRQMPAQGRRWSPLGFACGLAIGVAAGVAVWINPGYQAGLWDGILVGIATAITGGYVGGLLFSAPETDLERARTPRTVLNNDRTVFVASALGLGLAMGFGNGLQVGLDTNSSGFPNGFWIGAQAGLVNLIVVGLAFGFLQACWGRYLLAKWWLAASGRIPWRLMPFLEDAHASRGVLRQVGPVYQFRHERLQEYLAHDPLPDGVTTTDAHRDSTTSSETQTPPAS
jgi:Predicted NTPase (NACHT family)